LREAMAAFAAVTDIGKKRSTNEDAARAESLDDGSILLAVADGVGGNLGGDVASDEAINALVEALRHGVGDDPGMALELAFQKANSRVREHSAAEAQLATMATTMVAALIRGDNAWIGHVGDSRAYLVDGRGLQQLTRDHSWAQEQVDAGRMTAKEISESAYRNVITRAVGAGDQLEMDLKEVSVDGAEALLLCSDGLYHAVQDDKILEAFDLSEAEQIAGRLIELANAAGGPDNIAIAVVSFRQ
jgi:PPM family protein phosphatase